MTAASPAGADPHPITGEVLARLASTPDARMRELMTALVRHLHAFAHETRLTEAEWFAAVSFLTAVGQTCTERRQEFILLSDVLGLSMLVTDQNHPAAPGCTESTVFGPFHVPDAPRFELGADIGGGGVRTRAPGLARVGHHTRSTSIAMPCPTPMHIVATA